MKYRNCGSTMKFTYIVLRNSIYVIYGVHFFVSKNVNSSVRKKVQIFLSRSPDFYKSLAFLSSSQ